MTVTVNPTITSPTHHISLSDGSSTVGFILRNGRGDIDPRAITRRPRQNGQYSPFTQTDWGGGRGIKDAQADRSRYADGKRAITRHNQAVMIGPQETYSTGYRQAEAHMPGSVTWAPLTGNFRYLAYKVTASATGNRSAVYMWVKRQGTPTGTLTVELCADHATPGKPGTVLKTVTATTSNITDTVSQLYEFSFSSVQAVTATTVYWVKVYSSAADTATDRWLVATDEYDASNLGVQSADNTNWQGGLFDLYYRLVDDTDQLGGLFFTYKAQTYFVTRPSGAAAPKLFINGDRGVATGTHSTTTLQDSSKTWTADEWIGSTLLIIDGTNSEWQTPYRVITDNDTNTLTFSPAFPKAPVSANTIYVILGSNKWTEIASHGLTVLPTSVISAGDIAYFAQGDSTKMRKMREYLSGTTWTREFLEENNYAKFLGVYKHPTNGLTIFKVNDAGNSGLPSFAQAQPEGWGSLNRLKFPYLLDNGEVTTGWTFGANVTGTADSAIFQSGAKSIKMIKAAGSPTTTPFAYKAFTQYSVNAYKGKTVRFWAYCADLNITAGQVKFRISQATDCSTALITDLDLPAIPAAEWTQVSLSYPDTSTGALLFSTSFGFISAADFTLYIDGLELVPAGSEVHLGNKGEKITGVTTYGDPEVPWVFRTQSAGSIEGGIFNPIPLKEMSQAENVHNGMGSVVSNVYLYFSFLHGLERFYRNNLDDVGPNRDEGLPDERRGFITSMQAYPGRFFYNYDVQLGYSAIFESTSGTDHHEIYRCDTAGKRIRNLFIQVVPGDTADRLWFTEGDDIAWLPLPGNTLKEDTDDTYKHTQEGVLETGWIYGQEQDAIKLFHSVKLFLENTTANRSVEWDYKKNDETAWTPSSTPFTTAPVQKVTLHISARRIKLRFRLQTNDNTETPQIRGMVVEATTRPETRYTYTASSDLSDAGIDLEGDEDTTLSAATTLSTLDGWVANNTSLTLRSVFSPFDSKTVFLEPIVLSPLGFVADESAEKFWLTLNMIEP
jgi:hypothetical protein